MPSGLEYEISVRNSCARGTAAVCSGPRRRLHMVTIRGAPMIRLLIIVLASIFAAANPSPGHTASPEQRCSALGVNCLCSEPLEMTAYVKNASGVDAVWNPNDSTTKQCNCENNYDHGSAINRGDSDPPPELRPPQVMFFVKEFAHSCGRKSAALTTFSTGFSTGDAFAEKSPRSLEDLALVLAAGARLVLPCSTTIETREAGLAVPGARSGK